MPGGNLIETAMSMSERLPAGVLPIAEDQVGNLICLDGRDGRDGPVLFWDHEYEGDPPDEANLYEIAPDLPSFLDRLTRVIEFREPRPPVSAEELNAAELRLAELGRHLPPSYKAFLEEHDGGQPVRDSFSFQQDNQDQDDLVRTFFGIAPSASGDLVEIATAMWTRVPAGMLPIAEDPFGNLVVLNGRDGRDGPVLFWDHEYESDPPDEANLYEIAPDLQTFVDGLIESPPLAPSPPPRSRWKRLLGR
jgi:cell wall assembly regulator SMI1